MGFTANIKTEEEVAREKLFTTIGHVYSEYFNSTVLPEISDDAVDATGAEAKFTITENMTLSLSIVFPTGFVPREVEQERSKAKAVLTAYVSDHVDEIKSEMVQLSNQLVAVGTALEESSRSLTQ